jgi:hypothetical protein
MGITGIIQVCAVARIEQSVRELTRRRDLQRLQDLADLLNRVRKNRLLRGGRWLMLMVMLAPVYALLVSEGVRWCGI